MPGVFCRLSRLGRTGFVTTSPSEEGQLLNPGARLSGRQPASGTAAIQSVLALGPVFGQAGRLQFIGFGLLRSGQVPVKPEVQHFR